MPERSEGEKFGKICIFNHQKYCSNQCNFLDSIAQFSRKIDIFFFIHGRSFDLQNPPCVQAYIILFIFITQKIKYFEIEAGGKRIRLKFQTFVSILLFYVTQNARIERIFFLVHTVNFFIFLFGDFGGPELGQLNFEMGLAHPAHPLVTSLIILCRCYFKPIFRIYSSCGQG